MSVGKSDSGSNTASSGSERSGQSSSSVSTSRQEITQQASSSSKNRVLPRSDDQITYSPPEECQTWIQFREKCGNKFADKGSVAQYTWHERLDVTRQAQQLISRALAALESDIRESQGQGPKLASRRQHDWQIVGELREDKQNLDALAQSLLSEGNMTLTIKQSSQPHVEAVCVDLRNLSSLCEHSQDENAERKRNRRRPNKAGLVDGVQILDDYTQVRLAEFNRRIASERRGMRQKHR